MILTADGAIVIGIVIGSGDRISRLEEWLLLPPLLWREDGTRIDRGARATLEDNVVEIIIAPLPGSSCAGLAMSRWSARLSVASFLADVLESDDEYDLALDGAKIPGICSFVEPKVNPLVCTLELNDGRGWGEKNCKGCEFIWFSNGRKGCQNYKEADTWMVSLIHHSPNKVGW